ncbi:hypothetical protein EhV156_00412 [Emiliania huxleyi virus 156]|nr:hypothetical protein EhV156_00412 [Emiliania huxleyi virus 156]
MYKHLASLKTEANKSKNYRERNERTVIKKHKSVATLPESILNDIKSHILSKDLQPQEIYTSLLAIATTKYTVKKIKLLYLMLILKIFNVIDAYISINTNDKKAMVVMHAQNVGMPPV